MRFFYLFQKIPKITETILPGRIQKKGVVSNETGEADL